MYYLSIKIKDAERAQKSCGYALYFQLGIEPLRQVPLPSAAVVQMNAYARNPAPENLLSNERRESIKTPLTIEFVTA